MGDRTGIEWTDATWNPIRGCTRVSEGCRNCYAETVAARFSGEGHAYHGVARRRSDGQAQWTGEIHEVLGHFADPLRWRRARRVFVNSMSDLFHDGVQDEALVRLFGIMAACWASGRGHQFQILTKRPERMQRFMTWLYTEEGRAQLTHAAVNPLGWERYFEDADRLHDFVYFQSARGPLPNVWLGVSVEDQVAADTRVPLLLATPAAVRFLSCEPLLGPVRILGHLMQGRDPGRCANCGQGHGFTRCQNTGGIAKHIDLADGRRPCAEFRRAEFAIAWVIAGGESGTGARPMHPDWARSLRDQCAAAGVPFFFKQWGEWADVTFDENNPHLAPAGQWLNLAGGQGFHGERVVRMQRMGRKRAGRELDGRAWDEMPSVEVAHG